MFAPNIEGISIDSQTDSVRRELALPNHLDDSLAQRANKEGKSFNVLINELLKGQIDLHK